MDKPNSIFVDGTYYQTGLTEKYKSRKPYQAANPNQLVATIPGLIIKLNASVGQSVRAGENLITLEAMKMQNSLVAPVTGKISRILISEGQNVAKGEILLVIE